MDGGLETPVPEAGAAPALTEEWRDVAGFEGRYQVSDQGNVRSLLNARGTRWKTPRPVAQYEAWPRRDCQVTYLKVNLWCCGRRKPFLVSRLVLLAFVGPPPEGCPDAAHGPGGSHDNRLENLSWKSRLQNVRESQRWPTWLDIMLGRAVDLKEEPEQDQDPDDCPF